MKKNFDLKSVMEDDSIKKILAVGIDRGGCGWMRVRQWQKAINELRDDMYIHIVDSAKEKQELDTLIDTFDAVWIRNGSGLLASKIHEVYGKEKPIIFDHDDNTFVVLPSNQHYKDHGVEEVTIPLPNGKERKLWVHGQSGFDMFRNAKSRLWLEYLLRTSTLVTATTPHLQEFWSTFSKNVQVVPNAVDFGYYPEVEVKDPKKGNQLRIGWSGGISHAGDFADVGPVIAGYLKTNPNAVYYSQGAFWDYLFKGVDEKQIKVFPWMDFQANPFNIKTMCLDFAVIPLQDMDFNYYKSEIKFTEFSANKIPCLVKDQLPYSPYLKDGVNCLTYKDMDEFREKFEQLASDPILRAKLAGNAYDWVKKERDLRKLAPSVKDTLMTVFK